MRISPLAICVIGPILTFLPTLLILLAGAAPAAAAALQGAPLEEFVSDHLGNRVWNAYDQTLGSQGPAITGRPSPVVVPLDEIVHVYAQSSAGDLVEYVDDHLDGRVWNSYNQSLAAGGGGPIVGDPSAIYDLSQNLVHVYAESVGGYLTST